MLEPIASIMVRRQLRGVWTHGRPPAGPGVWAANHHGWWDPFVATALARTWRTRSCVLMEQANLTRFAFARAIGAFGTAELRTGLRFLAAGRVLVIYPEGELRPSGPIGRCGTGAAWYAHTAGVPLYAAAVRVVLRGQQAPEAYVRFAGVPAEGTRAEITARLSARLDAELAALDTALDGAEPRLPLPGYVEAIRGRRSPDERIQTIAGRLPWAT